MYRGEVQDSLEKLHREREISYKIAYMEEMLMRDIHEDLESRSRVTWSTLLETRELIPPAASRCLMNINVQIRSCCVCQRRGRRVVQFQGGPVEGELVNYVHKATIGVFISQGGGSGGSNEARTLRVPPRSGADRMRSAADRRESKQAVLEAEMGRVLIEESSCGDTRRWGDWFCRV